MPLAVLDVVEEITVGVGEDHLTLWDALRAVGERVIVPGGLARIRITDPEIEVGAGQADAFHAQGARVEILGADRLADGASPVTLLDLPNTVYDSAAGAMRTGADHLAAFEADRATLKTLVEARKGTTIRCTSADGGLMLKGGTLALVKDLTFVNEFATSSAAVDMGARGSRIHGAGSVCLENVMVEGFGVGWQSQYGGHLSLWGGCLFANCGTGLQGQYGFMIYGHDNLNAFTLGGQALFSHCNYGASIKGGGPDGYLVGLGIHASRYNAALVNGVANVNFLRTLAQYSGGDNLAINGAFSVELGKSTAGGEHVVSRHAGGVGVSLLDCYRVNARDAVIHGSADPAFDVEILGGGCNADFTGVNADCRIGYRGARVSTEGAAHALKRA